MLGDRKGIAVAVAMIISTFAAVQACGSDSSSSDGDPREAGASEAGATEGGAADGGFSSSDFDAAACPANTRAGDKCTELGARCGSATSCCVCLDSPGAPSCGRQWTCADTTRNGADCPASPPSVGDSCARGLACDYCTAAGPSNYFCGFKKVGEDAGSWSGGPPTDNGCRE